MTVTSISLAQTSKSTYQVENKVQLTKNDTLKVLTTYRYIVATRMLYRDYCGTAKVANQQLYTIQQQDLKINALNKAYKSCMTADSANHEIIKRDSTLLVNNDRLISNLKMANTQNKIGKITASVLVPVAATLSFLLGWYLHN